MQVKSAKIYTGTTTVVAVPERAQFVGAAIPPDGSGLCVYWVVSDQPTTTEHWRQRKIAATYAFNEFVHDGPVDRIATVPNGMNGFPIFVLELLP